MEYLIVMGTVMFALWYIFMMISVSQLIAKYIIIKFMWSPGIIPQFNDWFNPIALSVFLLSIYIPLLIITIIYKLTTKKG